MAFDFKKEYKEFYQPKSKPEIVIVPAANYIAVRGQGDPNEEGGAYQQAIGVLYAVAYTLKMSYKRTTKSPAFSNTSCRRWRASGGRTVLTAAWITEIRRDFPGFPSSVCRIL